MKTKIEIQNELIDAIIDWNNKGNPIGYSKAQELINEYERQVKLFATPFVVGQSEHSCQFERDERTSSTCICKHCGKERSEHYIKAQL